MSPQPHDERPADPLVGYRELFPILHTSNYLISNSLGAVPTGAYEMAHRYVDIWATPRGASVGGGLVGDVRQRRRPRGAP